MDVRLIAFIALASVLSLNGIVRNFGGDANPLSLRRLPEKAQAVMLLGVHSIKHLWSDACDDTAPFVIDAARERGIPVPFALSIARAESGFRSHVISSTGAMGVMQLMPVTAREHGVSDPFDPRQNARGAAMFLESLAKRYRGNLTRMAAAYNAGPARVAIRGAMRIPAETRSYAARVVRNAKLPALASNPVAWKPQTTAETRRLRPQLARASALGGM